MKKIFFLIFLLFLFNFDLAACCNDAKREVLDVLNKDGYTFEIKGPLSIANIERERMALKSIDGKSKNTPFGLINDQWEKLKGIYSTGDCIFYVISSDESWDNLAGREGYVLYRDGEIIFTIVTKIS